jgi:hypothetical protein
MSNALDEIHRLEAMLKAQTDLNAALERIVQLETSNENWATRCDSLATINAEVEQRCEKLEALAVDLYNALNNASMIRDNDPDEARMRELEIIDGPRFIVDPD